MRYYEGHEAVYQRLQKKGCRTWEGGEFGSFYMKPFLEEALSRLTFHHEHPYALEVGCGTGHICCYLAEKGFRVEGVDVSPTAVAMAKEEASKREFEISFRVADICGDALCPDGQEKFDPVVDGHCLHCIVTDEDRQVAFSAIRNAIGPGGYLLMSTMVADPTTNFGEDRMIDEDGFCWVKISESRFDLEKQVDGVTYVANRRVHRDPELIRAELHVAGFTISSSETLPPEKEGEPGMYQAICIVD